MCLEAKAMARIMTLHISVTKYYLNAVDIYIYIYIYI